MTKSSGTFCFHSPISMTVSSSWYESCRAIFNLKMKINGLLPNPFALFMLVILQDYPLFMFLYVLATKVITHFSDNEKRLTRSWVGGWVVDCGVHLDKHSWIFQKRLTAWIWDFLTFKSYYLGLFSQNFRSASTVLWKLESFCRGWLDKSCLVAKMQNFLPYQYLTFCQAKHTMDAVLLCQQDLW